MKEWMDIPGFEGFYKVSNQGLIKRVAGIITFKKKGNLKTRKYHERVLKPSLSGGGYLMVILSRDGSTKPYRVHRIVATAFIKNIDGLTQVNHKNGIKTDNRVENLEWCTCSQNRLHAHRTGLHNGVLGKHNPNSKLTTFIPEIMKLLKSGVSQKKIAQKFGVNQSTISDIKTKTTWCVL